MKRTYKILSFVLVVLFAVSCFGICGLAESVKCGVNASYVYNATEKVIIISGSGAVTSTPWNENCTGAERVIVNDGIISLPDNAFASLKGLTEAEIPESVISIGEDAFFATISYQKVQNSNNNDDFELVATFSYGVTVLGTPGSYAETYALDNGIPFMDKEATSTPAGDVNNDTVIDNLDLVRIKKYAVGQYQDTEFVRVDTDGDGEFTVLDIIRLKRYLVDNTIRLGR